MNVICEPFQLVVLGLPSKCWVYLRCLYLQKLSFLFLFSVLQFLFISDKCDGFACSDGQCLDKSLRCNGQTECADGTDEQECGMFK